jgi:hypothetical protein
MIAPPDRASPDAEVGRQHLQPPADHQDEDPSEGPALTVLREGGSRVGGAAMTARFLSWAYTVALKPSGGVSVVVLRAVLVALADHSDVRGDAWPSVERVAARVGLHPSTVSHALTELARQGVIVAAQGRSGGRRPTRWRLRVAASTVAHSEGSTVAHSEGSTVAHGEGSDGSTLAHGHPRGRPRPPQGSPTATRSRNEPAGNPSTTTLNKRQGPPSAVVRGGRSKNGRASGDEPAVLDAVAAAKALGVEPGPGGSARPTGAAERGGSSCGECRVWTPPGEAELHRQGCSKEPAS